MVLPAAAAEDAIITHLAFPAGTAAAPHAGRTVGLCPTQLAALSAGSLRRRALREAGGRSAAGSSTPGGRVGGHGDGESPGRRERREPTHRLRCAASPRSATHRLQIAVSNLEQMRARAEAQQQAATARLLRPLRSACQGGSGLADDECRFTPPGVL